MYKSQLIPILPIEYTKLINIRVSWQLLNQPMKLLKL